MMKFAMKHAVFKDAIPVEFFEDDAPDWLTSVNTVEGSTMDERWFWKDYVLTLEVGQSVDTDFQQITRVA